CSRLVFPDGDDNVGVLLRQACRKQGGSLFVAPSRADVESHIPPFLESFRLYSGSESHNGRAPRHERVVHHPNSIRLPLRLRGGEIRRATAQSCSWSARFSRALSERRRT